MPDLVDGETVEMKGSGAKPYVLKNSGGVYSCTWRNQSTPIAARRAHGVRRSRRTSPAPGERDAHHVQGYFGLAGPGLRQENHKTDCGCRTPTAAFHAR